MSVSGRSAILVACAIALPSVILGSGGDRSFSQAVQQQPSVQSLRPDTTVPPATSKQPATSSESAATPASPPLSIQLAPASPLKEKETIKEATKEIREHPSDLVGIVNAVAWPVVVFFILLIFIFSGKIRRILGLFPKIIRKVTIGPVGIDMEISEEAADEIRGYFSDSFNELIQRGDEEYRRMTNAMQISRLLEMVIETGLPEVLQEMKLKRPTSVRATIYVPDIVFQRCLYQFVDYYPSSGNASAGRRFSQRFGIIGRCWRLGESLGRGTALGTSANSQHELIALWGMTREEAGSQSRGHPAALCVILKGTEDGQLASGLIYIDTKQNMGFGDDATAVQVAFALQNRLETIKLATAVSSVMGPLRLAGPQLEITRTF
jgi:hypothetical protein